MAIEESQEKMSKDGNIQKKLCSKKKIQKVIDTVRQLNQKFLETESKKQPLLDEDSSVFLQVTMKKIPPKKMGKMIKVHLPHTLVTDTTEVCLITGDLDKRNQKAEVDPDILHYKNLLKKLKVTAVDEVVTLRQLRTEYKVYEARRQLMGAYDVFLADKKIAQCLPRLLGKSFYQKRKFPIQIDMSRPKSIKGQIDRALSCTVFALNCRGNSCTSEIGKLSMEDDQIVENILSTLEVLSDQLPGKRENIYGIYLKTSKSKAIPIFMSFGNPNDVKIEKTSKQEKVDFEELSTLPNAKVKVFRDGKIFTKKEDEELSLDEDNDVEDCV